MKKNYPKILFALLLVCTSQNTMRGQCTAPPPPAVSGVTIAGCVSNAIFTLTGAPSGTNVIGWYANPFGGNALSTNPVFTTPALSTGTTYYVGQSTTSSSNDSLFMPPYNLTVPALETRGYYFTAPHDFIITGLRVPVAIGGTVSGITVVKLPTAPPLYPSVTNTFSTLYLNQTITGTNVVSVHIPVYSGDIIGVLGERDGYSAYGVNGGTGTYASTIGIGGAAVTLNRMGMLFNLANTPPQDLWTETVNTIGIVEMYVSKSCNSTLTPVTVSVVPAPQIVVSPPPVICAGTPYTLSASGAITYTWSGGPQTSTYVVNPSTTTTYSIQGSISSNCSSTLSTVTVTVDPAVPTLTATSSKSSLCAGDSVTLNGYGAPTFTWAAGSFTISNHVAFFPVATQQYTLYGSNSCGISSKLITVTVNPMPVLVTNANPPTVCEGRSATLTVTGATTYSWDAASALGATLVVTPTVSSSYFVTGISNEGCSSAAAQVVVVVPNPTVTVGAVANKTLVCSGGPATLTSFGTDTYSWTGGPLTATYLINPLSTQVYTVTGTNTITQCSSTKTIGVAVYIPPLSISADTTVCLKAPLTLTSSAGPATSYLWSTGSTIAYSSITPTVTAPYSLTVQTTTVGGLKCSTSASMMVTLFPQPTVQITAPRTSICKGEKVILTASGGTAFAWTNQTAKTATLQVGPTLLNQTTVYTVTATDINGCQGTSTIGIKLNPCTGIEALQNDEKQIMIYPNPNNGQFVVKVSGAMQLSLVNELGQLIKELNFTEENNYQQNIQGLRSGIYFINGVHNGSVIQNKIVVTE